MQGSWWQWAQSGWEWAQPWWQWAQWLFFLPGNALIAQVGPTELGAALGLTQASVGSPASACISAALWVLAVLAVFGLIGFIQDAIDPTYRQQRREAREARARAQRDARMRRIHADGVGLSARIEPTFSPEDGRDAPIPEAEPEIVQRLKRYSAAARG
jgi:hypothetical protein